MFDEVVAHDVFSVVRGDVESFDGRLLRGWASAGTSFPMRLRFVVNGVDFCEILADEPRAHPISAGLASNDCGFSVEIPRALFAHEPCLIEIFDCHDRAEIPGSPVQIESEPAETSTREDKRVEEPLEGPITGSPFGIELRTMTALDPACDDDLAGVSDAVVNVLENANDACRVQAHIARILNWLQKGVDRANALEETQAILAKNLNDSIAALGGLQGSIGQFYSVILESYPHLAFRKEDSPRVTIVIPVHNKFNLTYDCVASIHNARTRASYEVIIVDDCSSDETLVASLVFAGGCKLVRTPKNLGFIGSCNTGLAAARGEFIIFLNNDTIVNDGWLDALVETLDRDSRIGVVGSRLLFEDGVLQEAGGIIWRDGSGWNYGRGKDKDDPIYSFMRDADYVSGAALMIRHVLLKQLSGFDEYYAPAYYEDTDLCFRARAAGYRVVVQPKSTIIHLEGQSNGVSTSSGLKRYQLVNARKFRQRWLDVLDAHGVNGEAPRREAERAVRKRALFIDETTLTPDQDAGSNAALQHILSLQRLGYKIIFLPAGNMAYIPKYTEDLQALGVECWYAPFAWSVEEYFRRNEMTIDLVYIHRKHNLQKYLYLAQKYAPDAPIIFNYADIHALRELREAELAGEPAEKIWALRRAIDVEIDLATNVDGVIVHSTYEAEVIRQRRPDARVHFVPWAFAARSEPVSLEGRSGILFVGGFAHQPNVDAVDWFLENIWSAIATKVGSHEFRIAGSNMPARFERLRNPNIDPVGFVAELDALLDKTLLTVAPLRFGAGMKGKVLSSLARGVPCLMTPVAAEGMDLPRELRSLIVQDAEAFGRRIIELIADGEQWLSLSEASVKFIRDKFSDAEIDRLILETLSDAAKSKLHSSARVDSV